MPAWLLSLLGVPVKAIGSLFGALIRWLGEDVRHIALFALLLAAGWSAWGWHSAASARDAALDVARRWEASARAWSDAHAKLLADVRAAQAAAEAADRANAARVAREMEALSERTANDYQARLDDTRAALDRVQRDYAAIAARSAGDGDQARVPDNLTARCQAVGAADCDALLAALPATLAAAEENTSKLLDLQDWVTGLLAIDLAGDAAVSDRGDDQ